MINSSCERFNVDLNCFNHAFIKSTHPFMQTIPYKVLLINKNIKKSIDKVSLINFSVCKRDDKKYKLKRKSRKKGTENNSFCYIAEAWLFLEWFNRDEPIACVLQCICAVKAGTLAFFRHKRVFGQACQCSNRILQANNIVDVFIVIDTNGGGVIPNKYRLQSATKPSEGTLHEDWRFIRGIWWKNVSKAISMSCWQSS